MKCSPNQLFGQSLSFSIVDMLMVNGEMSTTQLVETLAVRSKTFDSVERKRLYARIYRSLKQLKSMERITLTPVANSKRSKKYLICLVSKNN